jgi:hypothetical protein
VLVRKGLEVRYLQKVLTIASYSMVMTQVSDPMNQEHVFLIKTKIPGTFMQKHRRK